MPKITDSKHARSWAAALWNHPSAKGAFAGFAAGLIAHMLFELALGVTSGATKGGTVQSLSQDQNEPSHPSPPSPHLKPTATDLKPAMPSGPATVPLLPQDLDKLVRSVEQDPIDPGWLTAYGNLLDLLLAQVRVGSLEEQKRLLATTKKIVPIAHQRALGANLNLPPDMIGKEIQLSR